MLKLVVTILHLIIAFALMAAVLFQSSKSQGLSGSIAGGAETFFGKNKGKTLDGVLAKLTVVLAILFVITSVSLSLIGKESKAPAVVDPNAVTGEEATIPGDEEVATGEEDATTGEDETATDEENTEEAAE